MESSCFPLPEKLGPYVGQVLAVEQPPQGTFSQVYILSTTRGRFILKTVQIPDLAYRLASEAAILTTLRNYVPLVPQPVGSVHEDATYAYLFTCIEGEALHVVLQRSTPGEKQGLIEQYAQLLRRIHSWTPELPRPYDWLAEILHRVSENIMARPEDAHIVGTHSQFDGMPARKLLEEVQHWRASVANDIVFSHGDYCLPNVLVQDNQLVGCIDWSDGAFRDRRFDLATALFSLRYNGQYPHLATTFLQAYGYMDAPESLYFFEALHALTSFW